MGKLKGRQRERGERDERVLEKKKNSPLIVSVDLVECWQRQDAKVRRFFSYRFMTELGHPIPSQAGCLAQGYLKNVSGTA